MAVALILLVSVLLQFTAAFLALRLTRVTQRRTAWTLIAAAVLFMGVRRSITIVRLISGDMSLPPDPMAEVVALVISILMVTGVACIGPVFASIRRSEKALAEAARQWQDTFDAIDDMIAIVDRDHRIVRVNRAMNMLFKDASVTGASCCQLVHGTDDPIEGCVTRSAFETGRSARLEVRAEHLGGRWNEQDLVKSYEFGVNSYVVKPVEFDNFARAVSELGLYWLLLN